MNYYVGHPLQTRGAEQYVLKGGKGEGMNFIYARTGLGLEIWISVDRCADVSRVNFNGKNMSYTSPCGQVAPSYYDRTGLNFLKSFNAGFFTTCGLTAVGNPCTDAGEELPLHGTISNTPCENFCHFVADDGIGIIAELHFIVGAIFQDVMIHKVSDIVGAVERFFWDVKR